VTIPVIEVFTIISGISFANAAGDKVEEALEHEADSTKPWSSPRDNHHSLCALSLQYNIEQRRRGNWKPATAKTLAMKSQDATNPGHNFSHQRCATHSCHVIS
jgi:hypothetical protein